jgi:hypothetical protein
MFRDISRKTVQSWYAWKRGIAQGGTSQAGQQYQPFSLLIGLPLALAHAFSVVCYCSGKRRPDR